MRRRRDRASFPANRPDTTAAVSLSWPARRRRHTEFGSQTFGRGREEKTKIYLLRRRTFPRFFFFCFSYRRHVIITIRGGHAFTSPLTGIHTIVFACFDIVRASKRCRRIFVLVFPICTSANVGPSGTAVVYDENDVPRARTEQERGKNENELDFS